MFFNANNKNIIYGLIFFGCVHFILDFKEFNHLQIAQTQSIDTTVLTIAPLDMGINRSVNYMKDMCTGFAVSDGHQQIEVSYPAILDPSAGDNPSGSIYRGADELNTLIHSIKGPKIVFGYSQGAQVAGTWLRRFSCEVDAPSSNELSFVLIGNPERKYGKQPWTKKETPTDTQYKIRDVSRRNDNWSDWHGDSSNHRVIDFFGVIHTNYWKSNIFDPLGEIIKIEGNTTFVIIP